MSIRHNGFWEDLVSLNLSAPSNSETQTDPQALQIQPRPLQLSGKSHQTSLRRRFCLVLD